jgi:hypothetical protein
MNNLEDTQPHAPIQPPPDTPEYDEAEEESSGPGCLVWGLVSAASLGLALGVVLMAGAAGWRAGEQTANRNAAVTQSALINQQLAQIPLDVAAGNQYNLTVRLNFLETMTPGVSSVPQIRETATALYFDSLPTETSTPTETPPPVEETPETEEAPIVEIVPADDGGFDLPGLLQTARDQIAQGQYQAAYETLDVIIRVDSNFERTTVRGLMSQVLTTWAARLYQTTDSLAEAIRLTDLAEQYGPIGELSYERFIAGLYLNAQRARGARDHAAAIRAINAIRERQTTYKGINLNEMLFDEYVRYGDAWRNEGNYCQAVVQYNQALSMFNRPAVVGQRDNAQIICEMGTPTPFGEEGAPPIAPVGEPGN